MTKPKQYKVTITEDLYSLYNSQEVSFTSIFDKIYGYSYLDYTDNYSEFAIFIKKQTEIYFDFAIKKYNNSHQPELKKEIQDIALNLYRRYDVLIKLNDRDSFEIVLKNAMDFLKGGDYLYKYGYQFETGQVLFELIQAYYKPLFQEDVVEFFNQAFSFTKKYAAENKKWDYLSGDPDGNTLLVITQAISSLKKEDREQFSNLMFDIYTFCASEKRSYEVNQASGYIALLLTLYNIDFNIELLNRAIEVTGKYYQNNTFVHQTLYSKWVLTNDTRSALSYLKSEGKKKGSTFAIIALADLDCKDALPLLESMIKEEKDPIVIEVLKEAIDRLNIQNTIPEIENRMIWLNGNLTPTQRALGAESNNTFVKRAQEKMEVDDNVYETDDD